MSFTEAELTEALAEAERRGDTAIAQNIKGRIAKAKLGIQQNQTRNMPMMDAYLAKCISRCRPKGAK